MRSWFVTVVWVAWFVLAGSVGIARSKPGDKVNDRGTRAWADAVTAVSMAAAIAAAYWIRIASARDGAWLTLALGAAVGGGGIALRRWAASQLGRFFTQSITICERHTVITTGPYRFVRHPGYTGMLISMIGLALTLENWVSLCISVVACSISSQRPRSLVNALQVPAQPCRFITSLRTALSRRATQHQQERDKLEPEKPSRSFGTVPAPERVSADIGRLRAQNLRPCEDERIER